MEDYTERILAAIDRNEILKLEQACVRIPSPAFEEQKLADFLAEQMDAMGVEVTMMDVPDPYSNKVSRQPLGRLKGRGGGPTLMFNGHMDHNPLIDGWTREPFSGDYEDGWVHGRGSMDEKGGIVAFMSAVKALIASEAPLDGDILLAPVAGHKKNGVGTRLLIEKGVIPTYCINTENTGNEIITSCVGLVKMRISTYNQPIHFHALPPLRKRFFNPVEQMAHVIQALGPSHTTPAWLRHETHPDLPDYPQSGYIDFQSNYRKDGWCHLDFQVRTVPGVTSDTVRRDVSAVLDSLKARNPKFEIKLEIDPLESPSMATPKENPLVQALEQGYRRMAGESPLIGSRGRLGSVGDGQLYYAQGVPSVLFGPGTSEIFDQWPTPNEKIFLDDIVLSAQTMALAAFNLCGSKG